MILNYTDEEDYELPPFMDNFQIIPMDMEFGIYEQISYNAAENFYTILVNSRYNVETQKKAFDHAVEHILNGDFGKADVQEIEAAAHAGIIMLPDNSPKLPARIFTFEEAMRNLQWRKRRKAYHREIQCLNRKVERGFKKMEEEIERIGLDEWNDRMLRIHEEHKADPDWKGSI